MCFSGCLEGRLGHNESFLLFLFYSNSWGFLEIPKGLFFLLLYKGIGVILFEAASMDIYKNRKTQNIIFIIIHSLLLPGIPYW